MMPHEPTLDIMRRTMHNLAFVEQNAASNGPYEVTQLVNSFLGALAHPWQSLRSELNSISIADAKSQHWPIPKEERTTDHAPATLGAFIRLLRNGLAHGNISFLSNGERQITELRIENRTRGNKGRRTWGVIITPKDMKQFLTRFVALVEELDQQAGRERNKIA